MEAGSTLKVWKDGRLQQADRHDAALSSLCQAVERAVREHQNAGVRAVILMVDQPAVGNTAVGNTAVGNTAVGNTAVKAEPAVQPVPVYVDVFESGYSQDSGYGYGV
jgi:hypothetical protein